jgi:hypothetical protein
VPGRALVRNADRSQADHRGLEALNNCWRLTLDRRWGPIKRELSNDAVEGTKGGRGDPARPGLDEATGKPGIS